MWQANSELEKAIIAATGATDATRFVQPTGDSVAHLENSISLLQAAIHDIHNIIESYDDLLKKCVELEYKGNPLASQINKWNLKDKLEKNLFLPPSQEMWELVSGIIEQDNLVKYFKWERDLFKNTINPLQDLIKVLETCKEVAKVDPELFVKCVEFNQIPLRQYFFRVFNMWCKIDIAIEFSTSISTELFYQLEGHGSLTVVPPIPTSDDILKHAPSQVPASW